MTDSTMVGPGTVVTDFGPAPTVIEDGAVLFEGRRILVVGSVEEIERRRPDAVRIDAHGGVILPGLINAHHHFYSALARGLDPGRPLPDFGAILEGLWWRLDRALDREAVDLSARLFLADCIRFGCTTVIDHHASPSCIEGSLDLIGRAVTDAGLSAVLCYEISDRNGHDEALAGLEENLDFAERHAGDSRLRGLLGLHASFTVADETLEEAARKRPAGLGIHVHLAEDRLDTLASVQRFGRRPLERFDRVGLLDGNAVLIHGIDLERGEVERIAAAGAVLVHNPESNANNGVGRLDLDEVQGLGCRVALGTDGMSSAMLRSLRAAFLGVRAATGDPTTGFDAVSGLLDANARLAGRVFDEPLLGRLVEGAPADLIVVDPPSPTPFESGNALGHFLYGLSEGAVRHTVACGRVLLEDFRFRTLDPGELAHAARAVSADVWRRFSGIETPDRHRS